MFSWEYYGIFRDNFFYRTPPVASFVSLTNCTVMGICRSSPPNQEHNLGWFLLKRIVDLFRACHLHIVSGNDSNTLLLINLQQTNKNLSKKSTAAKAILF